MEREDHLFEELCKKGKAYRAKRMAAGEKSSAYLSGRAVKVCKGQMKSEGDEGEEYYVTVNRGHGDGKRLVTSAETDYEEPRIFSKEEAEEYIKRVKNSGATPGRIASYWVSDRDMNRIDEGKLKVTHRKSGYMGYSEPVEEDMSINEVLALEIDENITEAKFKGKTVKLNKPMRGDSKKFKVYVANGKNKDGSIKVKKVNFGHGGTSAKKRGEKTLKIRKSNPKARAAFRARHKCDTPGPKTMARYWSCKKW